MLLIYMEETEREEITAEERVRIDEACERLKVDLTARGEFVASGRLQPSSTATTYRRRTDKPVITDGPFAETKEVLAGYLLVDCANLDGALAVAAQFPALHLGAAVEVRPVMER